MRELSFKFSDIKSSPLLRGELYWCRPSGRRLCIGHAGEFANLELAQKLSSQNDQFLQKVIIDEERISKVIDHFQSLENANFEDEKLRFRNLILVDFYRTLKSSQKVSTLDFVFICHQVFYDLNSDEINIEEDFLATSVVTLKRAQVIASTLVYVALISGYLDFKFLKNVFNSVLVTYFNHVSRSPEKSKSLEECLDLDNSAYFANLTDEFFTLNYKLSDDIGGMWAKIHHKVYELELNFEPNDLDSIFNLILNSLKEYRYLDEIIAQEDIGRAA